ncbi:hypothetical protein ACISK3_00025 [Morganella morganii]|nr:hypothetical protein [Morganella morganii]
MGPAQGIQGYQTIQTLNNDIYGSTDGNSQSSYVSSSGIKSILSNAWNAIKSAFSNVLSAFGSHLGGQQGSDKPGREMTIDMSSRPAQPLPRIDAQFENTVYESSGGNIYDSVYAHTTGFGRPESLYASVDDGVTVREPVAPPVPDAPRPSLSEPLYSEIDDPLYEEIEEYQTPPPVPDSPRPSLSGSSGSEAESDVMESVYESSGEDIYTEPYDPGNTISTPENDPRGDSDYDAPWKSQPDELLQQRIMSERLKAQ